MTRAVTAMTIAVLVSTVGTAAAQTRFGIGAKAGSLGIGAEAAVSFGRILVLRGGAGFMPVEFGAEYSFTRYDISLPGALTVGVDAHPGAGGFRVSGGLIFRTGDPELVAVIDTTVNINGTVYDGGDVGSLVGGVGSKSAAPFATIGFGHHTSGAGLFLDLGVAFSGEPELTLKATADNSVTSDPMFKSDLEAYRQDIEAELDTYLKVFPIVQIGVKVGFGG